MAVTTLQQVLYTARSESGYQTGVKAIKERDGSESIVWSGHASIYRDVWFGSFPSFYGLESLSSSMEVNPIWAMSYGGRALIEEENGLWDFLKESLSMGSEGHPRGPQRHTRDGWAYTCHYEGNLSEGFYGSEMIVLNGKTVYTGWFQGGRI